MPRYATDSLAESVEWHELACRYGTAQSWDDIDCDNSGYADRDNQYADGWFPASFPSEGWVSMEVLVFQAVIVVSMILAYRTGQEKGRGLLYARLAAWAWTAETLILLFFPPLIAVQLTVIWGTMYGIRRHDRGLPILH